jgi:hypothetical protein
MAVKYSKIIFEGFLKDQNLDFWYPNIPSGNPGRINQRFVRVLPFNID